MKEKSFILGVFVFMVVLGSGCAELPIRPKKLIVEFQEPTQKITAPILVEVIDFKMQKIAKSLYGEDYGTIKIVGKAVYYGNKPFDETVAFLVFALYDVQGKLVRKFEIPSFACGEYKKPANIRKGEPFPFQFENGEIKKAEWEIIKEARFEKVQKL